MKAADEHQRYMEIALAEAKKALMLNEFPVGCVIVDEEGIVCTGRRDKSGVHNELEHAEITAIRTLCARYPERLQNRLRIYSTMEPCLMCFSTLILNNIHTIVYGYEDVMGGGTSLELHRLSPLYAAMRVEVIPGVLRSSCLSLFQKFFHDSPSDYLAGTLLKEYTVAQKAGSKRS